MLFGAVEDDHSIQPALGRTRKSLETVAQIMFGGVPDEAPQACGNAGNYAAVSPVGRCSELAKSCADIQYCMRVFLASELFICNPSSGERQLTASSRGRAATRDPSSGLSPVSIAYRGRSEALERRAG